VRDTATQTEQQPVGSRASSSAVGSSKRRSDLSGEQRSQSATSRRSSWEETRSSVVTDRSSRKEACGSSYSTRSSRLPSRHPSGEQSSRSGQSSREIGAPRDGPNSAGATSRPSSQTSSSSRRKSKNSGSVESPSPPSHSTPPQEE
jgi:hypothetical protein